MKFQAALYWNEISNSQKHELLHSFQPLLIINIFFNSFEGILLTHKATKFTQNFSNLELDKSIHEQEIFAFKHTKRHFQTEITSNTSLIIF